LLRGYPKLTLKCSTNKGMPKHEFRGLSVENLAKYWRYCRIYGVRNATRLAIRRLRKPMGAPPADRAPLVLPVIPSAEEALSPIEKTISVVIPTKNAGGHIVPLLGKLKAQQGILRCEIVVVDSGSTDTTVALAEREGVKVVRIAPQEFTHSLSRNKGAETATGDYLLFMVQDALPLTNLWLWEMVTALETNKLAAVSCAEYPRSDCDLFYQFLIHNQYDSAGLDQDRILAWDKSCSSYLGLRSNAQISDVAALIRRDVFENYRYKTEYAEDLDLGIRLIRDGHRLGFLHSTRVLHSHNRPSYYFLKRGYVDVRFLVEVFPNFVFPEVEDKPQLCCDILMIYNRVNQIARDLPAIRFPLPVTELMKHFLTMFSDPQTEATSGGEGLHFELREFMQHLAEHCQIMSSRPDTRANMIFPHVMDHLELLQKWICGIYDVADRHLAHDIVSALEKLFALHSGTHLAYLYLTLRNRGKLDEALIAMDRAMTAGV
jgi:glycosyltransferase involved in cell wall biosynthesis